MKTFSLKKNMKKILTGVAILGQIVVSSVTPLVAQAGVLFPEKVTIEFDSNNLYTMSGTLANGSAFSYKDAPLFAVYGENRQPVFCYEPGVRIDNPVTPGYTSNPLPDLVANNQRAKFISVLWKYAGTDSDTQIVAQAMFWNEVNGLVTNSIIRPDGANLSNQQEIQNRINQIVDDYMKKPSFHNQTVKVNLGDSVTLTDMDNAGVGRFDNVVLNSAQVNFSVSESKIVITPNADSKETGVLMFAKSIDEGTPVAYKLAGQQSVMAGAIDDPNKYKLNIEIVKTGEVKITKLDKGTGKVVPGTKFDVVLTEKLNL